MTIDDSHEIWRQVLEGRAPMTWELWAADIRHSAVLTAIGQRVLLDAVDEIAEFLGADWLEVHRSHIRAELVEIPFMSMRWWPANDVPHVHLRILEFALRIRLLRNARVPGLAAVRRNTKRDLGHFPHTYVQLEVAALALAGGWRIRLEPPPNIAGGSKVDLLLWSAAQKMVVEVKTVNYDDLMRADLISSDQIRLRLLTLSVNHQVQFDGEIVLPEAPDDQAGFKSWLDRLEAVATQAHEAGAALASDPPTGGRVRVIPDAIATRCELRMPIRSREPLTRLFGEIARKAAQGRGHIPLWLRFNETRLFFHRLISSDETKRVSTRDALVRALERNLALYPHVAGMVLSSEPVGISDRVIDEQVRLPGAAAALVRTTQYPWYRSTMVVLGPARAAAKGQRDEWLSWYRAEGHWLEWALNQSGLPPLADLVVGYER